MDAGVGRRCLWLFNVNVPWDEARWAQGPSISLLQAVRTGRVTSRACVTGLAWFRGGVAGSLETGDGRAQPSHACPGPSTLVTRLHPSGARVGREERERVQGQPGAQRTLPSLGVT